jgi:DNA invertase Pin-like site-specific DNA recombinase
MRYGYARVSTKDQNPERQLVQLREYIEDERNIIVDKESGKTFDRKGYNLLVGSDNTAPLLRQGDELYICSLDRLGRNYQEVTEQWRHITVELGCDIVVLDMPLLNTKADTDNIDRQFIAQLVLQILGYVSEKERLAIKERQRQGIECMPVINGKRVSSRTNKPTGRPVMKYPEQWETIYGEYKAGEMSAKEAQQVLGMAKSSFYKLLHRFESDLD